METIDVTVRQIGQLIPLLGPLLAYLQSTQESAGNLLLQAVQPADVEPALKKLINDLNFYGDLTISQIRVFCSTYSPKVLSTIVRLIITDAEPPLVGNDVGDKLMQALQPLNNAKTSEQCAMILGPNLDLLPRAHYYALGGLCAFCRDTCEDSAQLACLIGPFLLAKSRSGSNNDREKITAAATVLHLMMEESELVFGRVAGKTKSKIALGVRTPKIPGAKSKPPDKMMKKPQRPLSRMFGFGRNKKAPPPGLGGTKPNDNHVSHSPKQANHRPSDALVNKRKQQLSAFYLWRDPPRADHVEKLFDLHHFESIAEAVHRKYGMLPPGWRADLLEMKQMKPNMNLDWLVQKTGTLIGQRSFKTDKTMAVRAGRRRSGNAKGRLHTETATKEVVSHVDKVVNEICDTEHTYHDSIAEMLDIYVKVLRDIAQGSHGPDAKKGIGLSTDEVEQVFGWRLEEIVDVSDHLLSKLEVVDLVRSQPNTPKGRVGVVADAMLEIAPELHVYAPYVSAHRTACKILDKATASLSKGTLKKSKVMNFLQLWEEMSVKSSKLRGLTINSVLIMPVQRVPRYKLLLNDLQKKVDPDHPSFSTLQNAMDLIADAAKQINDALRQHEKLEKFFGAEGSLAPTSSQAEIHVDHNGSMRNLKMTNKY